MLLVSVTEMVFEMLMVRARSPIAVHYPLNSFTSTDHTVPSVGPAREHDSDTYSTIMTDTLSPGDFVARLCTRNEQNQVERTNEEVIEVPNRIGMIHKIRST